MEGECPASASRAILCREAIDGDHTIRKEHTVFTVAIAHSIEIDSADAVAEVLDQCRKQLGDLKPQAGVLFAGIDHDFAAVLKSIFGVYPEMELIGCTTDGELSSVHGYTEDSIALMAFCSDELIFKAGVADNISQDTVEAARKAVDSVVSDMRQEPTLCITTPTGLTASGDNMVEGLRLSLGDSFPVFGGKAGDHWRFESTYQFYKDAVLTDALPFLLIAGPLLYSFGVETGWIPIGSKERVTKSDKNGVVYRIGDDTALNFYKHYLGEDIFRGESGAIAEYPLAVYEDDGESFYLRSAIFLDRQTGSLTFVGNVPEGSTVQIAHSTRDKIVEAAEQSIRASVKGYPGTEPLAALCFSCGSRKQVLGTRVEEEYFAFKNSFPDLPVAGFYTYGEIGPLMRDRPARFHNETFVNVVMGLK
jgi:hypothetical protein